jgi:chromosome partitioning protein
LIRDNVALAEAPVRGKDIFSYDAKSNGAKDYESLVEEILN